ncbi:MAG: FxsA family protein [Rhodospirillales bacterium]|nr:FxsA family protein [Rhodospirillales bacterium]MDH3965725.1 FxsA family protein [Rhodospirillales bacterium]
MGFLILIALICVPLIEIAVFIEVGGLVGLWPTLALIVLTAVLGTWQLRAQGLATLSRARSQMERGEMPARELFNGLCLLGAGALLLTPGFVTDSLGALLFVPPLRDALRRAIGRYIAARAETRVFVDGREVHRHHPGGRTIDGEYDDLTERPGPDRDPSRRLPR